jgi:hypothetical protein
MRGLFRGVRLPRRYNEASFTFATSAALSFVAVERRLEEWAYALLYYGPQTRGSWQLPDCPHCLGGKGERREVCHTVDTGGREVSARH